MTKQKTDFHETFDDLYFLGWDIVNRCYESMWWYGTNANLKVFECVCVYTMCEK